MNVKKFIISGQYSQLLKQNNFDVRKILKSARLPENLFTHEQIRLNESEYYALMNAVAAQTPDSQTLIRLSTYDGIEKFSAPIFAAYCSENGYQCIERLKQYKPLIGPINFHISKQNGDITVALQSTSNIAINSKFYIVSEFLFLIHLLSKATEQSIKPLRITSTYQHFDNAFLSALGVNPIASTINSITFAENDLKLPFLTDNKSILNYLVPELNRRLSELDTDDSFGAQVRAGLVESLPAGNSSIDAVSRKLSVSKRTLQRKLKEEQTTFQQQLNAVRKMLAKSYLENTKLSSDEIAYLLGYAELNSFLRAFSAWTGVTISEYRQQILTSK